MSIKPKPLDIEAVLKNSEKKERKTREAAKASKYTTDTSTPYSRQNMECCGAFCSDEGCCPFDESGFQGEAFGEGRL